jgi:hypothetical protein
MVPSAPPASRFKSRQKVIAVPAQAAPRQAPAICFLSASGTSGTARLVALTGEGALPRHLSFQPRFGFCKIAQRAGEPLRGAAFRTRRHRACQAHRLDRGVTGGKRTANEQQIAHGSTPAGNVRQYRQGQLNAA